MNLKKIMNQNKMSERQIASLSNLSRGTVRRALKGDKTLSIKNLETLLNNTGGKFIPLSVNKKIKLNSNYSIPSISSQVVNGQDWKISFFNFVDYFRKNPDERLILLPPVPELGEKELALLKGIVATLCDETSVSVPDWAEESAWLKEPWFVSGFKSLKASSIQESPIHFRKNNVWVLENFLSRA